MKSLFTKEVAMLTESQIALIDALPAEGGAYYRKEGRKIAVKPASVTRMANIPLTEKVAPPQKKAIILHGAPGSGKTYAGMKRLEALVEQDRSLAQSFAIISYDEYGAMFDIKQYVAALKKIAPDMKGQEVPTGSETLAARRQLWLDFQPLSQAVRSETLKGALKQELNLYVDTTSSGMGTTKLIELLRDLDYTHIEFWSYHNHLSLSTSRIETRLRPTSDSDLYEKRVGAYEMLPKIVAAADRVSLSLNNSNTAAPTEFAVFRAGQFLSGHGNVAASVLASLQKGGRSFEFQCAQRYDASKAHELAVRLAVAVDKFGEIVAPAVQSQLRMLHHVQDRDFT